MDHAVSIACFLGLALTCSWCWLRIAERNTAVVVYALLASALLVGTVAAGSLGLLRPERAAGQTRHPPPTPVWVEGHWRSPPDDDLANNLGGR